MSIAHLEVWLANPIIFFCKEFTFFKEPTYEKNDQHVEAVAKVSGQSPNLDDYTEKNEYEKKKSSAEKSRSTDKRILEPSMKWKNIGLSAACR